MKIHKEGCGSYHFSVNVGISLQFTPLISDILVCIALKFTLGRIWYHYRYAYQCALLGRALFFTAIAVFGSVTFSVATRVTMSSNSTTYFTFNFSTGDYYGLHDYFLNSDFTSCYSSNNVEHIWATINHILLNTTHIFIPIVKIHTNQKPIRFNSEIRHCINHFIIDTSPILLTIQLYLK